MIEVYVKLVIEGIRTLESVPQRYRTDVEKVVKERKEVE